MPKRISKQGHMKSVLKGIKRQTKSSLKTGKKIVTPWSGRMNKLPKRK